MYIATGNVSIHSWLLSQWLRFSNCLSLAVGELILLVIIKYPYQEFCKHQEECILLKMQRFVGNKMLFIY